MTKNIKLKVIYKMFFGLLGLSAIITEIAVLVERGRFNPANFFSYFTIETNLVVALILIVSAIMTTARKQGARLNAWRGVATVYILVVGLGFSWLLSGLENAQLTAVPWDNIVLHYIMPVAVLIDWFIDKPKATIKFSKSLMWLWFPIAYVVYSLIRGVLVDWYPYPFLNPSSHGYGPVLVTIIGLLTMALALIYIVTLFSRKTILRTSGKS